MKTSTKTRLAGDSAARPWIPFPLVQPSPSDDPTPTRTPAAASLAALAVPSISKYDGPASPPPPYHCARAKEVSIIAGVPNTDHEDEGSSSPRDVARLTHVSPIPAPPRVAATTPLCVNAELIMMKDMVSPPRTLA